MMSGEGGAIDPEQLSRLSGMTIDPAMMQTMMRHLQGAFSGADEGVAWDVATRQALHIANQGDLGVSAGQRTDFDQALGLATLWLGEATTISELSTPPLSVRRRPRACRTCWRARVV
jgi:hypothetical protein